MINWILVSLISTFMSLILMAIYFYKRSERDDWDTGGSIYVRISTVLVSCSIVTLPFWLESSVSDVPKGVVIFLDVILSLVSVFHPLISLDCSHCPDRKSLKMTLVFDIIVLSVGGLLALIALVI